LKIHLASVGLPGHLTHHASGAGSMSFLCAGRAKRRIEIMDGKLQKVALLETHPCADSMRLILGELLDFFAPPDFRPKLGGAHKCYPLNFGQNLSYTDEGHGESRGLLCQVMPGRASPPHRIWRRL